MNCFYWFNVPGGERQFYKTYSQAHKAFLKLYAKLISLSPVDKPIFYSSLDSDEIATRLRDKMYNTTGRIVHTNEALAVTVLSKAASTRKYKIEGKSESFSDFQQVIATGLGNSIHYVLEQYETVGHTPEDIQRNIEDAKEDVTKYLVALDSNIRVLLQNARAANPDLPFTVTIMEYDTNRRPHSWTRNIQFDTAAEAIEAIEFTYNKCEFLKRDVHGDYIKNMVHLLTFNDVMQNIPGIKTGGSLLSEVKFTQPIEREGKEFILDNYDQLGITEDKALATNFITGIVDAIYVQPDGTVNIIDYKTHLMHNFGLLSDEKYVQQLAIYESMIKSLGFHNVRSHLIGFAFPRGTEREMKIGIDGTISSNQKIRALEFAGHFTGYRAIDNDRARDLTKDLNVKVQSVLPSARMAVANQDALKQSILDPNGKDTMRSFYLASQRVKNSSIDCKKTRENWNESNPIIYFIDHEEMSADEFFINEVSSRMSRTIEHTSLIINAFNDAKLLDQSISKTDRLNYLKDNLQIGSSQAVSGLVVRQLQDYLYGDWEIVPYQELNANNILLFYSKDLDEYQLVILTNTVDDVNKTITFGKSDTQKGQFNILGDFGITDDEFITRTDKNKCIGYRDGSLEPITFGLHLQLLAVLLFLNYAEALGSHSKQIGAVKCVSLSSGNGTMPSNTPQELADTLDILRKVSNEYDPTPRPSIIPPANISYEDSFITQFTKHAENMFRSDFDADWNEVTNLAGAEKYEKMLQILERKYASEFSRIDKRELTAFMATEYGRLRQVLGSVIYMCKNGRPPVLNKVNDIGFDHNAGSALIGSLVKEGKILEWAGDGMAVSGFFQGAQSASYANNTDNLVHQVNSFIQNAITYIHQEYARDMGLINGTIKRYLKAKSNFYHRYISGNQEEFYKMLLQQDSQGIDPQMLFKNPFKENLDSIEKKCLEEVLWYLNRRRNAGKLNLTPVEQKMSYENFKKTSKHAAFVEFVNENTNARFVPLRKADSRSKLAKIFSSKENVSDFYESVKEDLARQFDPKRFTSFQEMQADERKKQLVVMDRYSDSSHIELTNEHRDPSFFSFDVGALILDATLQSYEQQFFNETLRMTDQVIAMIRAAEELTGEDYSDKIQNILDRVIIGVYGETVLNKHLKDFNKTVGALKHISSFLRIAARPVLLIKESVVSLSKLWIKCQAGYFKGAHGIDRGNFEKAMGIVWGAEAKNLGAIVSGSSNGSDMSKVGMLNCIFAIANQDLNVTVENSKVDRFGLLGNWQRTMFKTSTAPDFYNRMGIMVAIMLQDGCYDAYSWNEDGNLMYDMAKDDRYSYFYAHKDENLSDEKFLKQKALYTYQLEQFRKAGRLNENGEALRFGDKLPEAYTSEDIAGIKESIGTTLGFYDHDQASTTDKKQHAFLHFQFMGYITGEVKNWLNTSKNSFVGAKVQRKDADGNKLYVMQDENGLSVRNEDGSLKITTQAVDEYGHNLTPAIEFQGHPVEGLLISFVKTARDVANFKELKRKWLLAKEADPQGEDWQIVLLIANTKVCLWYFLIGNIMSTLFAILFMAKSDSEKSEMEKQLARGYLILGRRIMQEFNPWSSIVDPLLNTNVKGIDSAIDLFDDVVYVLGQGDPSKIKKITNNWSALKDLNELSDFFE